MTDFGLAAATDSWPRRRNGASMPDSVLDPTGN